MSIQKSKSAVSAAENKKYYDAIHRMGRIGSIAAVVFMLGIPVVMGFYYGAFPSWAVLLAAGGSLLALFLPVAISEVFSYAPVLGSASYITFITGEVMNIKLPAAINALKISNVEQGTDEGDAIVTMAVSICSLFAMAVMLVGIFLFIPLQPVLEMPSVKIATSNMIPALFGCLMLGIFSSRTGKYVVKNKFLPAIPAVAVTVAVLLYNKALLSLYQGVVILIMLPVTIGVARVLFKKKIIQVFEDGNPNPLE